MMGAVNASHEETCFVLGRNIRPDGPILADLPDLPKRSHG